MQQQWLTIPGELLFGLSGVSVVQICNTFAPYMKQLLQCWSKRGNWLIRERKHRQSQPIIHVFRKRCQIKFFLQQLQSLRQQQSSLVLRQQLGCINGGWLQGTFLCDSKVIFSGSRSCSSSSIISFRQGVRGRFWWTGTGSFADNILKASFLTLSCASGSKCWLSITGKGTP